MAIVFVYYVAIFDYLSSLSLSVYIGFIRTLHDLCNFIIRNCGFVFYVHIIFDGNW